MKYPLIITLLSGLSTLLGSLLIFKKKNDKIIIGSLALASGVMISVSFFDLIKESFNYLILDFKLVPSLIYLFIFVISGIILASFFNYLIPNCNNLYRVGVYSFIAIVIHNIPEGIITFLSARINTHLGIKLGGAIALHNIPEGISIALPIYYAKNSKKTAILYTLISALSEPLGAIIAYLFIPNFNSKILSILLGLTAGIMIYISIFELLRESLRYNNKKITYLYFIIGVIIMLISNLII